jgi:aconitase A
MHLWFPTLNAKNAFRMGHPAVTATGADGKKKTFEARIRIDTPQEILYYQNGGILQYVLRHLAA